MSMALRPVADPEIVVRLASADDGEHVRAQVERTLPATLQSLFPEAGGGGAAELRSFYRVVPVAGSNPAELELCEALNGLTGVAEAWLRPSLLLTGLPASE